MNILQHELSTIEFSAIEDSIAITRLASSTHDIVVALEDDNHCPVLLTNPMMVMEEISSDNFNYASEFVLLYK